jgi:hypothetical protein
MRSRPHYDAKGPHPDEHKLQHVISDITGTTGMRIIRAILAGERDGTKLAAMKDWRVKNSVHNA